jgi:carbamoyl-phosphate synthase large subunit
VIRPSYVLGGRAMEIVRDAPSSTATSATPWSSRATVPCCSTAISTRIEVDVDALCDGEDVHVAGIMEHIEEAGVHSGDSACSLPPTPCPAMLTSWKRQTKALAWRSMWSA